MTDDDWRIDRMQAENLADFLKVPVTRISEDADAFTRELWDVFLGSGMPIPESLDVRWEMLANAFMGWKPIDQDDDGGSC